MTRLQRAGSMTESAHGKHSKHNSDDAYLPSESGQSSSSDEDASYVSRRSRSRSRAKDIPKSKSYTGSKLAPVKGSPSRSPSPSSRSPSRSSSPSRHSRPSQKSKSTAASSGSKKKKKAKTSDDEEYDSASDDEGLKTPRKGDISTVPSRKGSEARKYEVARVHREGAEKREGMWHEKEKAEAKSKQVKEEAAAARKASGGGGGSSVLKFILIVLVLGSVLFGVFFAHEIGAFDEILAKLSAPSSYSASSTAMPPLSRPTHRVAYNGRPLPVTMAEFDQNLVVQFNRIPNFVAHAPLLTVTRRKIQSALEVHSQTHLDALRARAAHAAADPIVAVDEHSLEWNQASLGLLQKPKPLVLVFASQGTDGSQKTVHSVVDALSNLAKTPFLDLQQQIKSRSDGVETVSPRMVHDVLNDFLQAASKTKPNAEVESQFPPLYRGVVLINDAQKLSREIAEAFHQYVDDVSAPFSQVAFIFQVTSTNMQQPDAFQLVEDVLKSAWRTSNTGAAQASDAVIQPLLSRVIRNVIDIRTL